MSNSYYGQDNMGGPSCHSNYGKGSYQANAITQRPGFIVENLSKGKPSYNITEASLKSLRVYRKICRMIPFVLRIHELNSRVTANQARLNVARKFREKAHLRDPAMVDKFTYQATEMLTEAEWKYCYPSYLYPFICPQNEPKHNQHIGYSYLDEKKYENKSKFLGTFYKGENSTY